MEGNKKGKYTEKKERESSSFLVRYRTGSHV